jgi:hypothetical protein
MSVAADAEHKYPPGHAPSSLEVALQRFPRVHICAADELAGQKWPAGQVRGKVEPGEQYVPATHGAIVVTFAQ